VTLEELEAFDPREATLDQVLATRARTTGNQVFLTHLPDNKRFTYAQIDDLTRRIGNGLHEAGIAPGAHVAVLMDNCSEQLLAIFGIMRSGRVAVPVNSAARGQLLVYLLTHADCRALIVEEALLPRFVEIADQTPLIGNTYVVRVATRSIENPQDVEQARARHRSDDFLVLLGAPPQPAHDAPVARFNDVGLLMYTSGTTGPSKAIMFSQAQFIYWGADVAVHHEYVPDDIAYICLPMFHGNALLGATMGSLMANAAVALAPRFSASRFWSDIRRSGATVFNGIGSVMSFLWALPPSEDDRHHRVNRCHLAPVPNFALEFEARYGVKIMSAYALTDYCLGAAYNTRSDRAKLGSAGTVRANVDLRIVDEEDLPVPFGMSGEIVMRHRVPWAASLGYYKAPEATLESRRNLWFHTGDRGWMDEDGYVWFRDRIKDSMRRRGENISAFEVEEVVRSHPAVVEAAAYPVRADTSEDEVAVTVIVRPGVQWSPEDLIAHCSRNLAYFMVPRYVEVVDSMPTTPSQKVEKYKLRANAEKDLGALWDRERAGIRIER